MLLKHKVVIVTGGAQGIGRVYATRIAAEGASVVIADVVDPTPAIKAIEQNGGTAIAVHTDVTSQESTTRLAKQTIERFGRIDGLINNAGIYSSLLLKPFEEIPYEEWKKVLTVNVDGLFLCSRAVVPYMREQGGGRIVNISSGTPFKGNPLLLHYVTSKGAVIAFTRALAKELGEANILVNAVAPGFTLSETVMQNEQQMRLYRDVSVAARTLKRDQHPEDIAGTVVFLLSDDSEFITGQTIVVDGGAYFH